MYYKLFTLLIWCLPFIGTAQCPDVLPTSDFDTNFSNFPFAWEKTKGENIRIGILIDESDTISPWIEKINKLAPNSMVTAITIDKFLGKEITKNAIDVAILKEEIEPGEYDSFISLLDYYPNITVIVPAYFGPMDDNRDYSGWREFITSASEHGAIIAGLHGDFYQLGDLTFWNEIPVDVLAVSDRKIDGYQPMMPDYKIRSNLEDGSCLVAGAVALLKSKHPEYSRQDIKTLLKEKGRRIYWSLIEITEEDQSLRLAIPHFKEHYLGKFEAEQVNKIKRNIYEASSLDLMLLFDYCCEPMGGWCFKTLHIEEANRIATGKNVTVAILDHGFDKYNPDLNKKLVAPHSFIEGIPALSDISDHGTEMAMDLIRVAPDVQIMPVVIYGDGNYGNADMYIKGINYAVENGADIISLSHRAINEKDQEELDEAIQNATDKGVTFVYINYQGEKDEVIVPGPVEFKKYNERSDIIYIIGTNFYTEQSSVSWGVSHTAPIVSGVIALMKELKPELRPLEIKQVLLESTRLSYNGIPILDAEKAVVNIF